MTEIAKYNFNISSSQRYSGTNTDLNIQLAQVITRLAKNSHFEATVHGATIPFSFYQLSSDIATLNVRISQGTDVFNGSITMTVGNYSTESVLAQLETRLTALCQGTISPCSSFTPTFNFLYNSTTSKSTLSITSISPNTLPQNVSVITLYFSTNTSLGLFFGFTGNAVFSTSVSATGTQPAVANPVNYLLIRSPSLRQFKNREWIVEKDVFSDILYRIPIQTNVNTYIHWYGDSHPVVLVNDTLSLLNFYLTTNLSYTPINLQELSWSFRLTITEVIQPTYDSLFSTAFINQSFPNAPQETDATQQEQLQLEAEKQDVLQRIERYKQKLSKKIPTEGNPIAK